MLMMLATSITEMCLIPCARLLDAIINDLVIGIFNFILPDEFDIAFRSDFRGVLKEMSYWLAQSIAVLGGYSLGLDYFGSGTQNSESLDPFSENAELGT